MKLRFIGVALALLSVAVGCGRTVSSEPEIMEIRRGPLAVWSVYDGTLEARNVKTVSSSFRGLATIVKLAPEGVQVKNGDPVVQFDSSKVESDLVRQQRDFALAKLELQSLEEAQLPLQMRELEMQLLDAQMDFDAEEQYLRDNQQLREEDLVSEQEVKQQELKVAQMRARRDKLETELKLTREYLQPSKLEKARATLASAKQELERTRSQLEHCTVLAPADGLVVYRQMHMGGEYRGVRVGDSVYRNQAFMYIPDVSDLLAHCYVPEAELAQVAVGRESVITPLAFPDMKLKGKVESVGYMAQTRPGPQHWQKYFLVKIALLENDESLRTGMSLQSRVFSYNNEDALLVPRAAVEWQAEEAFCTVMNGNTHERRKLVTGRANQSYYEVLEGLAVGERVLIR